MSSFHMAFSKLAIQMIPFLWLRNPALPGRTPTNTGINHLLTGAGWPDEVIWLPDAFATLGSPSRPKAHFCGRQRSRTAWFSPVKEIGFPKLGVAQNGWFIGENPFNQNVWWPGGHLPISGNLHLLGVPQASQTSSWECTTLKTLDTDAFLDLPGQSWQVFQPCGCTSVPLKFVKLDFCFSLHVFA